MAVVLGDLQMVRELITHGALPNTASEVWDFGVFLCVVKSVILFLALRIKERETGRDCGKQGVAKFCVSVHTCA